MIADRRLLDHVVDRLLAAGCVDAEGEADDLVTSAPDVAALDAWVLRREQGEPPAWIIGWLVFAGRRLVVGPGVYVPRPQTEELAGRAAGLLGPGGRALDLCTGAGAIAAHLRAEVPDALVVGVDVDLAAVRCARRNGVPAIVGDLDAAIAGAATFDVVTAVAPYVPSDELRLLPADVQRYEPRLALDGGDDGLDLVRRVVTAAGRLLRPGGWLLTEVGVDQDERLERDLAAAGFGIAETWHDEDGDLRGIVARRA